MVRTRSQRNVIAAQITNSVAKEIHAAARRLSDCRINPRSPSKMSKLKQKLKSKRESDEIKKVLLSAKQNLSKATDRFIPDRPVPPKTLFDEIHESILSGDAKNNLRPIVIVIDDD